MAGQVYFGNKNKQAWIKAPNSGMKASANGFVTESQFLNGGGAVSRSRASHRKFSSTWTGSMNTSVTAENLNLIKDFADGLYGDGPFYWIDPFAADQNILPPHWAAPMLAEKDWTDLSAGTIVPTFVSATVANNYPSKYAQYVTTNGYQSALKLTLVLPVDYSLSFGWHGPSGSSSSGIRIVPYLRSTGLADTALNPTRIDAGSTTRTNIKIKGDTYTHVEIFLATTTASTVKITAMIAQVLPENLSVPVGSFISGRGTSGLEFASFPQIDYYSSSINDGWIGMAVDWLEVE